MEIWKDVVGVFGYQVSSYGRVRSVDRVIKTGRGPRQLKGVILSPCFHSKEHPYPYVQLGRGEMRGVHTLVAEAFIGPRPFGYYVCHKDNDPKNNNINNLYYGSPKQNQYDRIFARTKSIGEKHGMSKITEEIVLEILDRLATGEKQKDIGEDYGITQPQVSHIKTGKRWAHLR